MNHLADYTEDEMRMLRGKIHDPALKYNGGLPFSYTPQQLGKLVGTLVFGIPIVVDPHSFRQR